MALSDIEDVFVTLSRYDTCLNNRIVSILRRLGFDSLKSISLTSVDELQESVKKIFGEPKRFEKLSDSVKLEIFGEFYVDDPKNFEFLPGERASISGAIKEAHILLEKYKEGYSYEKVIPGVKRKRTTVPKGSAKVPRVVESTGLQTGKKIADIVPFSN